VGPNPRQLTKKESTLDFSIAIDTGNKLSTTPVRVLFFFFDGNKFDSPPQGNLNVSLHSHVQLVYGSQSDSIGG
jgi:hypothetical protein